MGREPRVPRIWSGCIGADLTLVPGWSIAGVVTCGTVGAAGRVGRLAVRSAHALLTCMNGQEVVR
jgi:hypothetical protein